MISVIDGRRNNSSWLTEKLKSRQSGYDTNTVNSVRNIVEDVRTSGNKALIEYSREFDRVDFTDFEQLLVKEREIIEAYELIDPRFIEIIRNAKGRITRFHEKQVQNSWMMFENDGTMLGQKVEPIEIVGVYVPGGRATYPSSVLMNIIPAKIAGVKTIVMVTPPDSNGKISPFTLVAASEAGCDLIFKVGGAHAVAALAYGTETIPKVDKIVGPGNIYVTLAKKEVFGIVDIDMLAGPSEVLIIADETSNPAFLAADLMSQAEHDPMSQSLLLTDSDRLAQAVVDEIKKQISTLDKSDIVEQSFRKFGLIVVLDSIKEAIDAANAIAPEHLELCISQPFEHLSAIKHAGAIFLGGHSPEAIGDYMAGPNHVLPTNGSARFFSPLSVDHFVKKSSVISFTQHAFGKIANDIIYFSKAEGLTAHANSIEVRLKAHEPLSS